MMKMAGDSSQRRVCVICLKREWKNSVIRKGDTRGMKAQSCATFT